MGLCSFTIHIGERIVFIVLLIYYVLITQVGQKRQHKAKYYSLGNAKLILLLDQG